MSRQGKTGFFFCFLVVLGIGRGTASGDMVYLPDSWSDLKLIAGTPTWDAWSGSGAFREVPPLFWNSPLYHVVFADASATATQNRILTGQSISALGTAVTQQGMTAVAYTTSDLLLTFALTRPHRYVLAGTLTGFAFAGLESTTSGWIAADGTLYGTAFVREGLLSPGTYRLRSWAVSDPTTVSFGRFQTSLRVSETPAPVPEPTTLLLIATGGVVLLRRARSRAR